MIGRREFITLLGGAAATMAAYGPGAALLRNPITGIGCCARVESGHVAAPPSSAMNSRRFMPNMGAPSKGVPPPIIPTMDRRAQAV